jgi:membrane protease YdiL (CAAX protease family)
LLVGSMLLTAVLCAPLKPAIDAWVAASPAFADALHHDAVDGVYDYGRVYRRLGLLVLLVALLVGRRWLGPVTILGFGRDDLRVRRLVSGIAIGGLTWAVFIGFLALIGQRTLDFRVPDGLPMLLLSSAVAALAIGLFEETLVRGYLLGGLRRDWPVLAAVVASSALYAALHFMRMTVKVQPGWDAMVGVKVLGEHVGALLRSDVLGGFVGLTLLGVVFAGAYLWSRSIPFAAGLHAAWVFLIMIEKTYLVERGGTRGLYGPGGILAGPLGWAFLLLVLSGLWVFLARRRGAAA